MLPYPSSRGCKHGIPRLELITAPYLDVGVSGKLSDSAQIIFPSP